MPFSDFIDGATQLPRELIGGVAVAFGADAKSTNNYLGLANKPSQLDQIKNEMNPLEAASQVESNPAKFIGELLPYVFLPTRLFGKVAGKALKHKAKTTGKTIDKAKAFAENTAQAGVAFGAYGGIEEAAKAQLNERDSHIVQSTITDGLFAVGISALAKTAFIGASKLKDKASKSKYVKDMMLDAGFPPKLSSDISKLSEADKIVLSRQLDASKFNAMSALSGINKNELPAMKFKPVEKKDGILDNVFKGLSTKVADVNQQLQNSVEKASLKPHNERPVTLQRSGKGYVAKEASKPIGVVKMAGDDMTAHLNILGRHSNNVRTSLIEALPDPLARARITRALDVGGEKFLNELAPHEKEIALKIRDMFNKMGEHLEKEGIIKGFKKSYVPHILNKIGQDSKTTFEEALDSVALTKHFSSKTSRGMERQSDLPLHLRKDAKTLDIAELVHLYTLDVGRASAMRNVFEKLDLKNIASGKNTMLASHAKDGFVEIGIETHPSLITEFLKASGVYSRIANDVRKRMPTSSEKYIKAATLDAMDKARAETKLYIHPDFKPSIDLLMQASDMSEIMKGIVFTNFAMKRMLILGSMFHFNALSESALYAGAGGMGAMIKGAGAGFLLTGMNPLGAAVGAGFGAGAHVLVRTKNIAAQMRGGKYGDIYDFAQRYIDIKPPRDVGTDEFYNGLSGIQGMIDKYVPTNTAKGILKKGTKAVGGINKTIDVLMWHRLMAGAKITVFQRNLERLTEKNMLLPKAEQRSQHELASVAGQYTNDAFGGQDWRKLAEGVEGQFGRRWAAAAATSNGMKWANLAMFAPDWTISNLRVLAKAFPMINKDKLSRSMYQRYALRGAIYYAVMGSAIQYMLTGNTILSNDDPTKLDLGDGRTMTFSKQLSEPFQWIDDPVHEVVVKQSAGVKLIEELATNKQYIGGGNGTPAIWHDDETPIEKVGNTLQVTGRHFAPIFVQDIGRNGVEGVYGFFGHPIYGHIRHGFKQSDGKIITNSEET